MPSNGSAASSPPEEEIAIQTDERDVEPTYIGRSGETTVVARSARAAAQALGEATVDSETVAARLSDWRRDPQRTLYSGVRRLPAGMRVTVEPSSGELTVAPTETSPWHNPTEEAAGSADGREARFRELLDDQLRRLAAGTSRLDVGFSGGLDSSSLAATLAEAGREPVVWRLDDGCTSAAEGRHADALVERYDLDQRRVEVTPVELPDHFEAAVRHADGPVINPRAVSKCVLFREVAESDGETLVSGVGADEVFAGKPDAWHLDDDGMPGFAAGGREARRIGRSLLRHESGATPSLALQWRDVVPDVPGTAGMPSRHDDGKDAVAPKSDAGFSQLRALGFRTVTRDLLLPMEATLPTSLGNDVTFPFLTPAMVRFGLSLGRDDLLDEGTGKTLVRRAMAPVLGEALAWQDKEAVMQPPGGGDPAVHDRWARLLRGWLTRRRLERLEVVRPDRVAELLDTYARGEPGDDRFAAIERVLMRLASMVIRVDDIVSA